MAGLLFGDEATVAARPALERNYPELVMSLLASFWAAPVAGQFILSPWLPLLFSLFLLLAALGLWRGRPAANTPARAVLWLLLVHSLLILPLLVVRVFFSYDAREVAQGRHILLPAASAIAVLLVWGWRNWSPKIGPLVVAGLLIWSIAGQVVLAGLVYPAPISVWPQPPAAQFDALPLNLTFFDGAIQLNAASWQQSDQTLTVTLWWEAGRTLPEDYLVELSLVSDSGAVVGYQVGHPVQGRYPTRAWEPGDIVKDIHQLPLSVSQAGRYVLHLRLLPRTVDRWPEFDNGISRGTSLGQASLTATTSDATACTVWPQAQAGPGVSPGIRFNETLMLMSAERPTLQPATGDQAEIPPYYSVGAFHVFVVEADWPASADLQVGSEQCGLLEFDLPMRNFTKPVMPQPLSANFNNELQLLGLDLPTRRIQAGQRLPLTLYWQALDYMGEDYRIFANPLDTNQQRWGGYDRRPQDGYSTLRLVPGEVITDPFGIPIAPDAPDGIYTIDLGLYRETASGAESIPLVQDGQTQEQRSIRLGPIKVGGPPAGVVLANPSPQVTLAQSFGEQISLLGYSFDNEQGAVGQGQIETMGLNAADTLQLTLFWQADGFPVADYTTFMHIRDASNQTVAQKDGPPAAGRYPSGLWNPGEIIADGIILPLEELSPGVYTLVTGLYNPATGERLLTPNNPANEYTLQKILIKDDNESR